MVTTPRIAYRCVAIASLTTTSAAIGLALPAAMGRALDLLTARPTAPGPEATRWVAICAALTALLVALDALDGLLTATTNAHATAGLRRRALRHVLALGPRPESRGTQGDLVTRLVGNAAQAGTAPAARAATAAAVATPVGGLVALALIDPWLAAAFLLGMPALALLLKSFVRGTSDSAARYQRAQGEIAGRLVEALSGARTIAAARTADRERARVLGPLPELSRQGLRMWRVQGRATAQAAALVPLLQITVLAVAGLRVAAGEMTVGGLLAAARYAVLATGIGVLVGHVNGLVRARAATARLREVLAVPAPGHGTRALPPGGPGTLAFRGVTAVRGGRAVLDGVDLVVPGGTSLAVVGRSGSGKSSLAAAAGRLADPDEGTVTLDGVPLPELSRAELRRAISYAFERPALLGGTLAATIDLAAPEAAPPPGPAVAGRVARAARAACAEPFIRRLPRGYETPCAEAPLSGGEAQRLGLARAFAHPGRLLVLDDATSSLDTVTERRVGDVLFTALAGRTRLIVAHRVTTAARADAVAWLENGRVRAVGPHAWLWRLPAYRAVFTAADATTDPPSLSDPLPADGTPPSDGALSIAERGPVAVPESRAAADAAPPHPASVRGAYAPNSRAPLTRPERRRTGAESHE
ncbi:ABC transporter ATP-binding protein [Streptomyces sp. URMC 123]|uniref:ABC transporter ATP-binding protein n=1 Tax=Streptomyces sp. URMC 123 TaxID=3423403 RepID=UPI003F1A70DE